MKRNIINNIVMASLLLLGTQALTSCLDNGDETIALEAPTTGIPDDSQATPNPSISSATTNVPNIQTTVDYVSGIPVIRIDMTGVKNASDIDWLRLFGTGSPNQNIWVEVDDVPKGIDVYNNADQAAGRIVNTDVVFTVDNSGSMGEEANAIARDIISWAEQLEASSLDVRFGVVGYGGFISGAINLTDVSTLSTYLNRSSGTSRTKGFGGSDASAMQSAANSFTRTSSDISSYECGAMGIQFADKWFSFRSGANRIYVNFTDEPNQPHGNSNYSVRYFESQDNWPSAKGTVHTVYSDYRFSTNTWNSEEQPWLISEYTGGTTLFASSTFSGVTLSSLPVTGAMENSYIIRFANVEELLDGQPHKVHITILTADGTIQAEKTFYVVFVNA